MVPVIQAVAAPSSVFSRTGSYLAAEKLLSNIGRIPVRQSRRLVLQGEKRQILPPGRKGCAAATLLATGTSNKPLKKLHFY
jgi:hypothetical protein